jgi:hypothetical protein
MKNLPIIIIFLLDITMPFIMLIFYPDKKVVHYLCFMSLGLILLILIGIFWATRKFNEYDFEECQKKLEKQSLEELEDCQEKLERMRLEVLKEASENKAILQSILDDIKNKKNI